MVDSSKDEHSVSFPHSDPFDPSRPERGGAAAPEPAWLGSRPYEQVDGEGGIDPLVKLRDRKGGDWEEWPWRTLRVRQFPEVRS